MGKKTIVFTAIMGIVFFILLYSFSWFSIDDVFINFRYSENLAKGHGLVWNPGEDPVEGYTTFGWVVLNALAIYVGISPIIWSQMISVISAIGIVIILILICRKSLFMIPLLGTILLNPFFAIATVQGMETTTTAFVTMLSAYLIYNFSENKRKSYLYCSFFLSTIAMFLRPDLVIFFLAVYSCLLFINKESRKKILSGSIILVIIPLLIWFIWRVNYYGNFLPNPFYVKALGGTIGKDLRGVFDSIINTSRFITFLLPLLCISLPSMLSVNQETKRKLIPLIMGSLIFIILHLFIVPNMGFFFRFQIPILGVILMIIALVFKNSSFSFNLDSKNKKILGYSLIIILTIFPLYLLDEAYFTTRSMTTTDLQLMGKALAPFKEKELKMYASESGAVPYYSGWNSIDTPGLNSVEIARNGLTYDYLKKYDPDIIFIAKSNARVYEGLYNDKDALIPKFLRQENYSLVAVLKVNANFKEHHFYVKNSLILKNQDLICALQSVPKVNYKLFNEVATIKEFGVNVIPVKSGCGTVKFYSTKTFLQEYSQRNQSESWFAEDKKRIGWRFIQRKEDRIETAYGLPNLGHNLSWSAA